MSAWRGEFRAGWRNLAAATLGIGLGVPAYTPISSLFFQALRDTFGWSNAATAGALIALPITALLLPLAGLLIDRFGVRLVSGVSALLLTGSFVWLAGLGGGLPEYYAALIALNVFGCATGPIAYTRLVAAQFLHARGAALAVAQFGIAVIAIALPPLLAAIIAGPGWRTAYLVMAAIVLGGGIGAQLLMRQDAGARVAQEDRGTEPGAALRTRDFWLLSIAILLVSAGSIGLVSQLQPVLLDRGIAPRAAGYFLSVLAMSVLVSRLAVGRLLDLPRANLTAAAVIAVAAIGALILVFAGGSVVWLSVGILLFGVSVGAELDLMSFFCARLFGVRYYSAIYGMLAIFFYVGMALGGIGYGVMRDVAGDYRPALVASVVTFVLSAAFFFLLRSDDPGSTEDRVA